MDSLDAETASVLAVRATVTDIESWATAAADADGRIGVLDLLRVLDVFRAASPIEC